MILFLPKGVGGAVENVRNYARRRACRSARGGRPRVAKRSRVRGRRVRREEVA